jgi:hemolysin activation/secretion protein
MRPAIDDLNGCALPLRRAKTKPLFGLSTISVIALTVAIGVTSPVLAQNLPPAADPGRVPQRFEPPQQPRTTTDQVVPQIDPERQIQGDAARIKFNLTAVVVEGATVYNSAALSDAWAGMVGRQITLADAQLIADRITARYRNDGYILSRAVIPAQRIAGGSLRIVVVEGYIKDYRVEGIFPDGMGGGGPISGERAKLMAYAEKMVGMRPITAKAMERYLLLANDLPGITAQAVLAPAQGGDPGGATLVIQAKKKAVDFFASVDNYGSRFSGPYQGQAGVVLNSPFGLSERIGLRGINTLGDWNELHYLEGNWDQDIGSEGTKIGFSVAYSKSRPGNLTLPADDIEGTVWTETLRISHPFVRSRTNNWYARGSLVWRDVRTENGFLEATPPAPDPFGTHVRDHLRILRVGTSYDLVDRFRGVSFFDIEISKGLPVFGYTKKGDDSSRPEGTGNFTKITGEVSRLQSLFVPGLNLYAAAQGQLSFNKLLSSEEFGVGGSQYGRGYDPSEIAGDSGFAVKLELQYGGPADFRYLQGYQFFAFWDYGKIWNKDKANKLDGTDRDALMSAGAGVRLNFIQAVSGEFFLAKPLTRGINGRDNTHDWRGFFSLTTRF